MKRFSRKRQSIIDCLRSTREHPNAEWVYEQLKPQYPDLSLGTVYRNLRELTEQGVISSRGVVGEKERFDADCSPHIHAVCRKCGRMVDVEGAVLPESMAQQVDFITDFETEYAEVQFFGLCAACRAEKEQES